MIYLDNSATTPLCAGAKNAIEYAMEHFGNPSSLHFAGEEGAKIKKDARDTLLKALDARKEQYELVFTSGGTEANNLAIFGVANAKNYKNPKILISDSEHPCILEPCKRLAEKGFRVVQIPTRGGRLDEEVFYKELDENTVLVSFMSVNNETGAVYRIKPLFDAAHQKNPKVLCHTDGVQAFLKISFTPKTTGADLLTVSSHKVHGPKGCGGLLISKEVLKRKALLSLICGGGQEDGLRSGTENTLGIAGFAGAVAEKAAGLKENAEKMRTLRAFLLSRLPEEIHPNLPESPAPHILSLTLPNIKSQTALNFLSSKGICVSSGSACANNGGHQSYVLTAFGLTEKEADSTLRISLSEDNTEEELLVLLNALEEATRTLVRFR